MVSEAFIDVFTESSIPPPKWPHKCDSCGRFVSHDAIRHTSDSEGQYWATAHCANCDQRVNANPI